MSAPRTRIGPSVALLAVVLAWAEGAEVDELYLVCRGRSWTVEAP